MNQSICEDSQGTTETEGVFRINSSEGAKLLTSPCVRYQFSAIITVCISLQSGMLKRSNFTLQNVNLELLFFFLFIPVFFQIILFPPSRNSQQQKKYFPKHSNFFSYSSLRFFFQFLFNQVLNLSFLNYFFFFVLTPKYTSIRSTNIQ